MVTNDPNIEILEGMSGGRALVVEGVRSGDRNKHLMYWRKCTGCQIHTQELGWITTGPAMGPLTGTEYFEFQQSKHAEPLEKYGKYLAGRNSEAKYDITNPPERFHAMIEQGGWRDFPTDQLIAYNLHRNRAWRKYRPELEEVIDYPCTYGHADKIFNNEADLNKHIRIWHNDIAAPQAIGREISKIIESQSGGVNLNSTEGLAALVVAIKEALSTEKTEAS